jgi:polyferredoxin
MLPAGVEGTGLVVFFAALAVATLWRGRMWCSHCCPFGVLSELGGRLTGARARAKLPAALGKAARFLPWVVFGAVAGTVAWTGRMSAAAAEPFGFAAQLLGRPLSTGTLVAAAPLAAAVFGAALLLSLISLRFYCRFLCGAGALLGLCCRLRASRQAEPGFNRE